MNNRSKAYIYFLICFLANFAVYAGELVLLIMIKNEATVIEKTLQPFVDAGVTRFVVLDTGSTDNTVEVVQNFFQQHNLNQGYLVQEPFVDFATSRNVLIEWAERFFDETHFFFMIDAEWYVYGIEELMQFCHEHDLDPDASFFVLIKCSDGRTFYTQKLFRSHTGVRFVGVTHEVINRPSFKKVPESSFIVYAPSEYGRDKSCNRWYRDKELLLKEVEKHPNDARSTFYLAQTCHCLGELKEAAYWYEKRCEIQGWDEENFMAHYRLAQVYEAIKDEDNALKYYMKSYNLRPSRIEPLIKLARYYWFEHKFAASYMFAYAACRVPFPADDVLFIENSVYDYDRYDVLGCAAWYVNEFEQGKLAVEQALKTHPEQEHLQRNLSLYNEKLLQG